MADTNAGKTYFISDDAVSESDLDQSAFEALDWTAIGPTVGSFPAYGKMQEMTAYEGHDRTLYGSGAPNYGNGEMELPHAPTDAGQVILRAHGAKEKLHYAIKVVHGDATGSASGDKTATTDFLRVKLSGPNYPDGSSSDRVREVYQLGIEQHLQVLPTTIA